ncbi:MAG TPA: glycosyltransferase family A protein [Fibrobacteria bacterium]|nr:glycosyltransferase family A protein [Fibrobacteria bacterium]
MPVISLALATYNQAPLLRRFLENYLRDGASLIPLIVVDDGSDDGTPEVLRELGAHANITVHSLPHVSAAHARNHALRACPTPWLAFSDTDCLLDRRYFETLSGVPARFPAAAAVEGAVRPTPGPKPPFTHSLHNPGGGTYATANMVFKAAEVLALGGFDEGFTVNFREDTDLALTILDRLGPIPFCADLTVEHPHVPRSFLKALRTAYSSQDRVVRAEMRLYQKHPRSYARVRHHPDARGTLSAWCRKYSALYLKECLRYLFRTPGVTGAERLRGLVPAGQAMAVAFLEQACIGAICAAQWGAISRLRAR